METGMWQTTKKRRKKTMRGPELVISRSKHRHRVVTSRPPTPYLPLQIPARAIPSYLTFPIHTNETKKCARSLPPSHSPSFLTLNLRIHLISASPPSQEPHAQMSGPHLPGRFRSGVRFQRWWQDVMAWHTFFNARLSSRAGSYSARGLAL